MASAPRPSGHEKTRKEKPLHAHRSSTPWQVGKEDLKPTTYPLQGGVHSPPASYTVASAFSLWRRVPFRGLYFKPIVSSCSHRQGLHERGCLSSLAVASKLPPFVALCEIHRTIYGRCRWCPRQEPLHLANDNPAETTPEHAPTL